MADSHTFLRTGPYAVALVVMALTTAGAQTLAQSPLAGNTSATSSSGNVSKIPLASLLYPGATTKIYVRFMPWFGQKPHLSAGYRSDDPEQVRAQISDMIRRGISGAFVAWYGQKDSFKDGVTAQFMRESERQGFQFALSFSGTLDSCARDPRCDVTEALVSEINYASQHYMGSTSYVRVSGRPVFFIFDLTKYSIDWQRVRREAGGRPLLLFRNSGGFTHPQSDGAYAWLAPEAAKSGDPAGLEYLDHFYRAARQNRGMVVIGSTYKGFDDSQAEWGKNRHISEQCGQTWLQTFAKAGQYYSQWNQLPMLLVVTWNDYEEGTEIETGVDNCVSISAQASGTTLRWSVSGDVRTIDHFTVFSARDDGDLTPLTDVSATTQSINLESFAGAPSTFYVEAVGKAGLLNHMSNAVNFRNVTSDFAAPSRRAWHSSQPTARVTAPARRGIANVTVR